MAKEGGVNRFSFKNNVNSQIAKPHVHNFKFNKDQDEMFLRFVVVVVANVMIFEYQCDVIDDNDGTHTCMYASGSRTSVVIH